MKYLIALLTFFALTVPAGAYASSSLQTSVRVNAGYYKGNFRYTIVVKTSPNKQLVMYTDDLNSYKAKANKSGWATFRGVPLASSNNPNNTGKLSFTEVVHGKQVPINYTRRYTVVNNKVSFTDLFMHPAQDITNVQNLCSPGEQPRATFDLTNHSSHAMAYDVTVESLDSAGKRVGTVEGVFNTTPGQRLPNQYLDSVASKGACGVTSRLAHVNAFDSTYINGQPSF